MAATGNEVVKLSQLKTWASENGLIESGSSEAIDNIDWTYGDFMDASFTNESVFEDGKIKLKIWFSSKEYFQIAGNRWQQLGKIDDETYKPPSSMEIEQCGLVRNLSGMLIDYIDVKYETDGMISVRGSNGNVFGSDAYIGDINNENPPNKCEFDISSQGLLFSFQHSGSKMNEDASSIQDGVVDIAIDFDTPSGPYVDYEMYSGFAYIDSGPVPDTTKTYMNAGYFVGYYDDSINPVNVRITTYASNGKTGIDIKGINSGFSGSCKRVVIGTLAGDGYTKVTYPDPNYVNVTGDEVVRVSQLRDLLETAGFVEPDEGENLTGLDGPLKLSQLKLVDTEIVNKVYYGVNLYGVSIGGQLNDRSDLDRYTGTVTLDFTITLPSSTAFQYNTEVEVAYLGVDLVPNSKRQMRVNGAINSLYPAMVYIYPSGVVTMANTSTTTRNATMLRILFGYTIEDN